MAEPDGGRDGAMPAVWTDVLLERDRELAVLEGAARDAAVGCAGLVVVEGPAGIGKSRLLSMADGWRIFADPAARLADRALQNHDAACRRPGRVRRGT